MSDRPITLDENGMCDRINVIDAALNEQGLPWVLDTTYCFGGVGSVTTTTPMRNRDSSVKGAKKSGPVMFHKFCPFCGHKIPEAKQ